MLERSVLTVVTPAMAKRLVPVATVRAELGILDTSEDAKIGALIDALSREFAGATGLNRPLLRQTYAERTRLVDLGDDFDGNLLQLARWPIESVTSVATAAGAAVDAADYAIVGEQRASLYRNDGWLCGTDYLLTYVAGWIPPGDGPGLLLAWSASATKKLGAWTKPVDVANGENPLLFQCTTSGATGGTEPTWPTTAGGTVTDGTVTWTARAASELPEDLQQAALVTATAWYGGALDIPAGIQSESAEGFATVYDVFGAKRTPGLPPFAKMILESYK